MPVVKTKGSASSQGFGEFAQQGGGDANWIDDVFSTYLWSGTSAARSINNGIDLSTKGGMVWIKDRKVANNNVIFDTARGASKLLITNQTGGQSTDAATLTSFNTNGFSLDYYSTVNESPDNYVGWTFAKQAKFFDVVTYTGTGSARTVAHNLGSAPGCMIIKNLTTGGFNWIVYHRSLGATQYGELNNTGSFGAWSGAFNDTAPTSSVFTVGFGDAVNKSGDSFVAYLFAHDAGGFGTAGTDNVISCGSFTGPSATVTLGYEPQYILFKNTANASDWLVVDNMRGMSVGNPAQELYPNTSGAESYGGNFGQVTPTATGFSVSSGYSGTYIYIAIRRPMKPPTTGTEVFSPITSSQPAGTDNTTNFPVDMQIMKYRPSASGDNWTVDRLRGINTQTVNANAQYVLTNTSGAEAAASTITRYWTNPGFQTAGSWNNISMIYWNFKRASTFFDEVCYTGDGVARTLNHNLTVAPELIIIKNRSSAGRDWVVQSSAFSSVKDDYVFLDLNSAKASITDLWTTPTSTTFGFGSGAPSAGIINTNGNTYVAYLFATVAGVSKVGSYTGTGTVTQTINAGFGASGARYVLIKRTDASGSWYVFDSARGFTSSSSPYLILNTTAAEVTGNNGCYAASTGFTLTTNASSTVNVNGGSYIYLAIS